MPTLMPPAFVGIHNKSPIRGLYVAADRQNYVVNWSSQDNKRNVVPHAAGGTDDETGYVFGAHLDFDPP